MDVISSKKRNTNIYYAKVYHPHKTFVIFNNQLYNSYPNISMKRAATVAFDGKVSEGYRFKKDSQFNSHFSIAMRCCGCSASQTFDFDSLAMSY